MPARSLASGTISFGLVSIPVKLFAATQSAGGVSFNLLHKKCGSRLRQQYICPVDNEVVERSEMVKGYEHSKDRYVVFTPEELKELEEKATETIEIAEFIPQAKIDPVYYDRAYYLAPEKGGEKAYRLLSEVMRRTGKTALARYAARGKQYLVMLRPLNGGLVLQQLLYADEVRSFSEVPRGEGSEVKETEVELATKLVEQISADQFKPEVYEDEGKKRILEVIRRKAEGESIASAPAPQQKAQIIDLMAALKASLELKEPEANANSARKPPRRSPRVGQQRSKASHK